MVGKAAKLPSVAGNAQGQAPMSEKPKKRKPEDADASEPGPNKVSKTIIEPTVASRSIQHEPAKKDTAAAPQKPPATLQRSTKTPEPSPSHSAGCYLVYTLEKPGGNGFVGVFSTKAEANARVRQEFYEMHPEGWAEDDFARHADAVRVDYNNELLQLSLQPPHKTWAVAATWVPTNDPAVTKMQECYLVVSLHSFVGNDTDRRVKFIHLFTTKEAANALMKKVFYERCSWNWTREQFTEEGKPWTSESAGMGSLCKVGSKGELWQAEVMPVRGGDLKPLQKWYVVHSTRTFRQERNGLRRDPVYEFYPPLKTKEEASALAEQVFYRENPWAWTRREFAREPVVTKYHQGRLLELSVRESILWAVCVVSVPEDIPIMEANPGSGIVVYGMRENYLGRVAKDPNMEIEAVLRPADSVDARVEEIFYKHNPYGWSRAEFHEQSMYDEWRRPKIERTNENGFPKWSIAPPNNPSWKVRCKAFNHKPLKPEPSATPSRPSSVTISAANTTATTTSIRASATHSQREKTEPHLAVQLKPKATTQGSAEWFLVYSNNARFPYEGPDYQFFPLFQTREEANATVKHVYYKENPCGWTREDFDDNKYTEKATTSKEKDGLLTLSMHDEEEWTVKAIRVPPSFRVPVQADAGSAIVIYSLFGYLPDGFHSAEEQEFEIQAVVTSKEAAATRVKEIFNDKHSYELSIAELTAPRRGYGGGLGHPELKL